MPETFCPEPNALFRAAESYCTFELPPPFVWKVGCGEISSRTAERGDRDSAKDVAVTTTITDQHAFAEHEYRCL